ncbi:sulfatase [Verrucomicrobiota bacterium]
MRLSRRWVVPAFVVPLLLAVAVIAALMLRPREAVGTPRPHVLLISLDTLRADHLGCYGHVLDTSPFLDHLAGQGVRFHRVISQSPKTAPSHMTMFTGFYPSVHGVHIEHRNGGSALLVPLGGERRTLTERLRDYGYRAAAWTGGGQVTAELGFGRGFDEYREDFGGINARKMEAVRDWFSANSSDPCFMFVHTYQIHDPYVPPKPFNAVFDPDYTGWIVSERRQLVAKADGVGYENLHRVFWREGPGGIDRSLFSDRDIDHLKALYDGGILYTDGVLRGFFEDLVRLGLLHNTLVIVTSDHGEEFLEHGGFLHEKLYRETLWVPLIMSFPGRLPAGRVVEHQVRLIDLAPTVLDVAGLAVPEEMQGRSLMFAVSGGERDRVAYSEEPWIHRKYHRSLRDGRYVLYDKRLDGVELYDARQDPSETRDLAREETGILGRMEAEMGLFIDDAARLRRGRVGRRQPADEGLLRRLRALGYVR